MNKKYHRDFEEGFRSDEVQQDIVLKLTEILLKLTEILPVCQGQIHMEKLLPRQRQEACLCETFSSLNPQAEHHLPPPLHSLETYFTVISTVHVVLWLFVYTFFFPAKLWIPETQTVAFLTF